MSRRFAPLSPAYQPMLFVAIAFSVGISGARYLDVSPHMLLGLTAGSFFLGLMIFLLDGGRARTPPLRLMNVVLLLGLTLAGGLLYQIERVDIPPTQVRRLCEQEIILPGEPVELIGQLSRPPEAAPQRVYLDLDVTWVKTLKRSHPTSGQVRLMLPLPDGPIRQVYEHLDLRYGTKIRTLTFLRRSNRYRNPGSPDYTEYLDQRGYDASGILKNPRLITVLARNQGEPVLAWLYHLRRSAEAAIESVFSGQTEAVLKALLLGNRHFISRETAEAFRAAGTFHILVISGMHVGFLAVVLLGLISAITRHHGLRFILIGGSLWAYALVIGLDQTPVVRATTMITVGLAAPVLFRRAQTANAIGLAGFILLVIEPRMLFAPGFQLTFLAVASLVMLAFPLINRLRAIGRWRPSEAAPYPPRCPSVIRWLGEVMYWDQRAFDQEMASSPITFRLDKVPFALALNRVAGAQTIFRAVCLSLIASTVVQTGMLPLMILYFHRVALCGILLNITVSVLVALFILSGVATFAAAQISLTLTPPLVVLTDWFERLIKYSMAPVAHLHWASFRVADYSGWASSLYWLYFVPLIFLALRLHRWQPLDHPRHEPQISTRRQRGLSHYGQWLGHLHRQGLAVLFLLCFFVITAHPSGVSHREGWLTISFLDVDQGDSAFVDFPRGTTMLIDSGGRFQFSGPSGKSEGTTFVEDTLSVGEAVVSNFLWSQGLDRIDYILPTHADADHIKGFTDILKNFSVGRALLARVPADDPEFRQFERARQQARTHIQFIAAREQFMVDGVIVDVLWPPPSSDRSGPWGNDESVVLKMTYGQRTFLLTGDITHRVERTILASGIDIKSDVLKVPHHGSRTSSTEAFIRRIQPHYAIISVGEHSPFGHPHREVVQRYHSLGIKLLQTGQWGTITIATDGERLELATYVRHQQRSSAAQMFPQPANEKVKAVGR